MAVMNSTEFVNKAKDIANNYKTLYVMGCIGDSLKDVNKPRYCTNYDYNRGYARTQKIKSASADTFGFDCVCLIKAILWGWTGDLSKSYGGAKYASNGVPDINELGMINACGNTVSYDFSKIVAGEVVWISGHIGIYIGDGLVVECTPQWKDGVQITALGNIGVKTGYPTRKWTKHGRIPYVDYSSSKKEEVKKEEPKKESVSTSSTSFLPEKGYWTIGDKDSRVEKLCEFLYDTFPAYAKPLNRVKKNLLGDLYGDNCKAWIKEFQDRTVKEAYDQFGNGKKLDDFKKEYIDGDCGPMTYAMLKKYGFKE